MHDYGPAALIIFSIFVGILLNHREVTTLKADMNRQFDSAKVDTNRQFDKVDARLTRIEEDLKRFHGTDKELEGRINQLSEQVNK